MPKATLLDHAPLMAQLQQTKSALITVHQFPDIDAIGSAIALYGYLKTMHKDVVIWTAQPLDQTFDFLPYRESITHKIPDPFEFDTIIVLDSSNTGRVRDFDQLPITDQCIVNIDHHTDNNQFGNINYVDYISSVGELLTQFFNANNISITSDMATCLYAAMVFDTGRFAYSNVTAQTLAFASQLVEIGASPVTVHREMHENKTVDDFTHLKGAIDALQVLKDHRLAYTTITIKKSSRIKVIDFIRQLEGIDVFVVFQVLNQSLIKVNLRSQTTFDVSSFASQFGGGGHRKASGILYKGSLEDCQNDIISTLKDTLN